MSFSEEIEAVVRRVLREELARLERRDQDDLMPHTEWQVGGRKRAARLASSGVIPARRVGRLWYARRRDVEAFLAPPPEVKPLPPEPILPPSLAEMARASARKGRRAA